MQSRTLMCIFAITLFTALALPVPLAAQEQKKEPPRYTITDLGTLGGTFSDVGGVNNQGAVSGFSTLPGDMVTHAFLWQRGQMTDLGTLGGPDSRAPEASPPNDRSEVAGFSDTSNPDPNGEDFLWSGNQPHMSPVSLAKRCDDAAAHAWR